MSSSAIARASKVIIKALNKRHIALVEIDYDGEGDSGQIEDIRAIDGANQPVPLDQPIRLALRAGEVPTRYGSLRGALDDYAWMLLEEYHGGYENNDGGYGTIVIDPKKNSTTIDHNDRISDVVNTTTEV